MSKFRKIDQGQLRRITGSIKEIDLGHLQPGPPKQAEKINGTWAKNQASKRTSGGPADAENCVDYWAKKLN